MTERMHIQDQVDAILLDRPSGRVPRVRCTSPRERGSALKLMLRPE
jgi:hypothetical protein